MKKPMPMAMKMKADATEKKKGAKTTMTAAKKGKMPNFMMMGKKGK